MNIYYSQTKSDLVTSVNILKMTFHHRFSVIGAFCLLMLLCGCSKEKSRGDAAHASFYYWRSNFALSFDEKKILDSLHTRKLYMKFFDVDWNPYSQTAQPLAVIQFQSALSESIDIVPTVFITNRTFDHLRNAEADQLTEKIKNKIFAIVHANIKRTVKEMQIDCDWTGRTRKIYFRFLELMKNSLDKNNIILSATIRLHQYSAPNDRGVPPVHQGVLMFYNMGEMEGTGAVNSILDLNIGRQYLRKAGKYPIHLDIALPLYNWGVLIRRGKIVNLLHDMQFESLKDSSLYERTDKNLFSVRKSHYDSGVYLYANDQIRYESVSMEQLKIAVDDLRDKFYLQSSSLIFFQIDPLLEKQYGIASIRSLLSSFYN